MSKEREPASGATEVTRRATGGAAQERRDGRGRWSGETQLCSGSPIAARRRPRNTFGRTGGDRRTVVGISSWRAAQQTLERGKPMSRTKRRSG
jgi:hypothetical protein